MKLVFLRIGVALAAIAMLFAGCGDSGAGGPELVSIAVSSNPSKTIYIVGDKLNLTGLVVTATYDDGTTEAVTDYTSSPADGADLSTEGTRTVTVTYKGQTASFTVTVNPVGTPQVESIAITKNPTKTTYWTGDTLDLTGMVVTATYDDASTKPITDYIVNPDEGDALNTAGSQKVTVTYEGKTAEFNVTVKTPALQKIEVTTQPDKKVYVADESLDTTGMVITATYENGSTSPVTTGFTTSGFDSKGSGTQTVTVTYEGKTATFTVEIKTVTSIAITTEPSQKVYAVDEKLNLAGMVVTATYSDSTTGAVTGYTASPAAGTVLDTAGTNTITISYGGKTADFTVTVKTVASIAINTTNVKDEYWEGDKLDLSDLVVTATYSDASTAAVTGYRSTPANGTALNTAGPQPVEISYGSKTDSFEVTVKPLTLTGITINTAAVRIEYREGNSLDLTGLVVTAAYSNETTKPVTTWTSDPVEGTIFDTAGDKTVIISYNGKTARFDIGVKPVLTGIAVTTLPSKTSYIVGERLNLAGMVVTATYSNDNESVVTDAEYTAIPANGAILNTAGTKTVEISYGGKTTTFNVTVTPPGGDGSAYVFISAGSFSGEQAPPMPGITIYRDSDNGLTSKTLIVLNPEQYSEIGWHIGVTKIDSTAALTLDAKNTTMFPQTGKYYYLTLDVWKNGKPYSRVIPVLVNE